MSPRRPLPSTTKTITVATYPAGTFPGQRTWRRHAITRTRDGWEWRDGAASSSKAAAIEHARALGATITTEPNPAYVSPGRPTKSAAEELRRLLGFIF